VVKQPKVTDSRYIPSLHRVALLTAAATFPLIFMGGLVTSHGAGMSVPDWPNSYGYNMFTFPPSQWLSRQAGGVFYEHSHRLMGSLVGMLSIALCAWAWKTEPRRWVRWLATGVLAAVIFQGVLGGLRVVLKQLDLAIVHACVAQAFFCLAALTAVVTSRWWVEGAPRRAHDRAPFRLAAVLVLVVYLQLVVGAVMRHYRAGLAIPDLPLAYGKVLPPVTAEGLARANETLTWDAHLPRVTLGQVWLHFGHRVGALVVTAAACALVYRVLRQRRRELLVPSLVLVALLLTQVTLGVLTVLWRKPADVASAHVAVGALVLVTSFVMAVRAARVDWVARRLVPSPLYSGERVRVRGAFQPDRDEPLTPSLSPEYRGEGVRAAGV
jgi:cytochrome c oxidase assembly protein subunit 15